MQEELDGRRSAILPDEHGGMVGIEAELGAVPMLAASARKRFDARLAVRAAHPAVAGAELEVRERARVPDRVDGGQQRWRVHAVPRFSWGSCRWCHYFSHVRSPCVGGAATASPHFRRRYWL